MAQFLCFKFPLNPLIAPSTRETVTKKSLAIFQNFLDDEIE
jgi:hypothetical protein